MDYKEATIKVEIGLLVEHLPQAIVGPLFVWEGPDDGVVQCSGHMLRDAWVELSHDLDLVIVDYDRPRDIYYLTQNSEKARRMVGNIEIPPLPTEEENAASLKRIQERIDQEKDGAT